MGSYFREAEIPASFCTDLGPVPIPVMPDFEMRPMWAYRRVKDAVLVKVQGDDSVGDLPRPPRRFSHVEGVLREEEPD